MATSIQNQTTALIQQTTTLTQSLTKLGQDLKPTPETIQATEAAQGDRLQRTAIEQHKYKWDKLTDGKTVAKFTAGVVTAIAALYCAKLSYEYALKQMGRPQIFDHWSYKHPALKAFDRMCGRTDTFENRFNEFVCPPGLEDRVPEIFLTIKSAQENGTPLPNMAFLGDPGTGKTMLGEILAHQCGLEFAHTTGPRIAALAERKDGSAILEIQKMFKAAKQLAKKGKGILIFIDEANAFLRDRKSDRSNKELSAALEEFLANMTDGANKGIMFIIATNLFDELDPAVKSRFSKVNRLVFKRPEEKQIAQMFSQYLEKEKTSGKTQLTIAPEVKALIMDYAQQFKGEAGREIKACAVDIGGRARQTENKVITDAIILKSIRKTLQSSTDEQEFIAGYGKGY